MSVGTVDIATAINSAWDEADLDGKFTDLGGSSPSLNDQDAGPEAVQPYCVLDSMTSEVVGRMTGGSASLNRHLRNIGVIFQVHATLIDDDCRTAKQIAAYLVEEIMKVFGGHPTESPSATLTLAGTGNHVVTQYVRDFGIRTGDNNYQWTLEYNLLVDVPVAI